MDKFNLLQIWLEPFLQDKAVCSTNTYTIPSKSR
jgi:hypothetical protein